MGALSIAQCATVVHSVAGRHAHVPMCVHEQATCGTVCAARGQLGVLCSGQCAVRVAWSTPRVERVVRSAPPLYFATLPRDRELSCASPGTTELS